MREVWKEIPGFEGLYSVSSLGRIKSHKKWCVSKRAYIDKETIINPTDNGNGYQIVGLRKDTVRYSRYVHRLVAEAFCQKPDGCNYINHLDFDKKNNIPSNLQWCTQRDNVLYSADRMRHPNSVTHSSTGEKGIYKRGDRYRVVVDGKERPTVSTFEEALAVKRAIIEGGDPGGKFNSK